MFKILQVCHLSPPPKTLNNFLDLPWPNSFPLLRLWEELAVCFKVAELRKNGFKSPLFAYSLWVPRVTGHVGKGWQLLIKGYFYLKVSGKLPQKTSEQRDT